MSVGDYPPSTSLPQPPVVVSVPKGRKKGISTGVVVGVVVVGIIIGFVAGWFGRGEFIKAQIRQNLASLQEPSSGVAQSTLPIGVQASPVALGDVITTDKWEIELKNAFFTSKIEDADGGLYYPAGEGQVWLEIDALITNLDKEAVVPNDLIKVTADYAGGYTYAGSVYADLSTFYAVDPLTKKTA
jgi:hypothetical protein